MPDTTPPPPPVPPVPPPAADANVPPQPSPYVQPAAQPNPYAQPAAPPNPYGAPAYAYAPGPRTNTLAIVGFVLSFIVSVAGIICSHIALSQIKRTGEGGRGLALAGLILGYVFTAFWALYIIGIIVVLVIGASQGYSSYSY